MGLLHTKESLSVLTQKPSATHYSRHISFYKSVSWRILGGLSTIGIAFFITHQWRFSLSIGGLEFIAKIGLFYWHERLWCLGLTLKN